MKTEKGIMVMKNGKAWGCIYADGRSTAYGWMDPESAEIHDPRFCKKPTDVACGTAYIAELSTAAVVMVERTTTVAILPNP
jgi:hypothetical protein